MRGAIFTAVYGGYESQLRPLPADIDVPAYCFTDSQTVELLAGGTGWTAIVERDHFRPEMVNPANGDPAIVAPMLAHKFWKTHPQYAARRAGLGQLDYSIWLDANMEIITDSFIKRNVEALGDDDLALVTHPWRGCVYDEAVYTSTLIYRYDGPAMMRHHDRNRDVWQHPAHWGLFASGHHVVRHNARTDALGALWWCENLLHSHQDQLSLPVVVKLMADRFGLRFNRNLPWAQWWVLHGHGS